MKLILASKSPRRYQILSRLGIPFKVVDSNLNESKFRIDDNASVYAEKLAFSKCKSVSEQYPKSLVIGADTIVVLKNKILGKPKNESEARKMLEELSGNTHTVITAVSFQLHESNLIHTFNEKTKVKFFDIPNKYLDTYISSGSPYDKAGAYGIQDYSSIFVDFIVGCYDNVVGFPLSKFVREIEKNNIKIDEIS